jgi:hypothetical protein
VVAPSPGLLAAMLKAQRLDGVLRWKVNFTQPLIAAEANLAGWDFLWLDSASAVTEQEFIDLSAQQISRPDLVGCGLVEIVRELVALGDITRGICIAWTGWQDLIKSDPSVAKLIAEEIEEAGSTRTNVVLVCDSSGAFPGISELTQG